MPYAERCNIISANGIAVWDVLRAGIRPGSLDAAIKDGAAEPNDFGQMYVRHPELQLICFNGKTAERLFRKLVAVEVQESFAGIKSATLPSTSPAYAAMGFEEKLLHWRTITDG